ncbi:MAG TPA: hypothetical protein PKO23_01375 [Candidatus Hydrogenedentes bacterium]|nr:hypothetical protein [Candidatus Hydrogenedentota bacterium]
MKPRILIIALFLLAVAIAGGLALWREPPPPSSRSEATAPGRPYAGSPNAAAIDAALGFLLRHEKQERPSWQVYALLDYLQRRFGLDEKYRIENAFPREVWPEYDLEMAALFGRLADNTFRGDVALLPREPADLNRFLAGSLYCDQHPVDAAFIQQLLDLYEADCARPAPGYIATHVILACQWLRELGCDQGFPELETQWSGFPGLLETIINRENAETDLAFEAIMLLYYMGEGDRVWDAWVDIVRRLQRPTGAWGYRPEDADHGHPTVLALWVLLEQALPGAEKDAWVR